MAKARVVGTLRSKRAESAAARKTPATISAASLPPGSAAAFPRCYNRLRGYRDCEGSDQIGRYLNHRIEKYQQLTKGRCGPLRDFKSPGIGGSFPCDHIASS